MSSFNTQVRTKLGEIKLTTTIVSDRDELAEMEGAILAAPYYSYDTESSGLKPQLGARAIGHCLATVMPGGWRAWYVPIRHVGEHNDGIPQLPIEDVSPVIQRLFDAGKPCAMHHGKFDIAMARADGVRVRCPVVDTAILATVDNENEKAFGLKPLATLYCSDDARKEATLLDDWMKVDARGLKLCFKKRSKKSPEQPTYLQTYGYARTPIELCGKYGAKDAFYTLWLWLHRYSETWSRYPEVTAREHAVMWQLHEMEWRGLSLDVDQVHVARQRIADDLDYWLTQCRALAGDDFELSPVYLKQLLYARLALPVPKQTKSGADSTDRESRKILEAAHPEHAELLIAVDKAAVLEKLRSTYAESFLLFYSPESKCLYPSYNQLEQRDEGGVPVTGRLSSSSPNIQNVASRPLHLRECKCSKCVAEWLNKKIKELDDIERELIGDEVSISIRRYFTVAPGFVRVYIDFSQIELRVLAWFSRDPKLLYCYANDMDVHALTSEEVTAGDRVVAKQVNFGNSYGMSKMGLARRMPGYYQDPEGTREQAEIVLTKFFKTYAGIPRFRGDFARKMRANGNMFVNPFGRPRRILDISAHERWKRERAERRMMSSIISGTAADIMKESLLRCAAILEDCSPESHIVQTIHDELVIDLRRVPGWASVLTECVRAMERWPLFADAGVPIRTNTAITTTTWEAKKEITLNADGTFAWAA